MRTRLIIGVVCIFSMFLITQLSPNNQAINPAVKANSELTQLSDFNFLNLADRLWDEGNRQGAVVALNTAIQKQTGDSNANVQKILLYKSEIVQDQTLFGRLKALGTDFSTTEGASSATSLKGQLWQEFNIFGTNIIMEPNSVGDNLSNLEELAKLYSRATENYNVLKALVQSGALTGPMAKNVNQTIAVLQNVTTSSSNLTKISQTKSVIDQLVPVKELIENAASWHQVKIFLANCATFKQVRELTQIIKTGDNATKLEQLITVLGNRKKHIHDTINYIQTYGQNGLDNIHAAIVKGAKGIQFVLTHPTLLVDLQKGAEDESYGFAPLREKLATLKARYGNNYEVSKNLIIATLLFICIMSWLPKKLFLQVENQTVKNYVAKNYLFIVVSACTVIFLILLANEFLKVDPVQTTSLANANTGSATTAGQATPQAVQSAVKSTVLSPISWSVMLIFLILHAIVGSNTKSKIFKLSEEKKSTHVKLQLLKNIEHDLDLSVYIGLAGTVTSFIIMQFDPSGSRILAYSSTLAGIIISCFLKTVYYQPMLNKLIAGTNANEDQGNE